MRNRPYGQKERTSNRIHITIGGLFFYKKIASLG